MLQLLLNKYVIGGALFLAAIVGAYWKGYREAAEVCQEKIVSEQLRATIAALQERDRVSQIDKRLTDKIEELKANEKTIERERVKLVDRPIYHNVCLDADGVQLVEAARAGKPAANASSIDVAVP